MNDEQLEFKRLAERVTALEAKAGIAQTEEPMIDQHAPFTAGQLCYAVARPYKGDGPIRLILHKAEVHGGGTFGYGAGEYWVIDLPEIDPTKQQPQYREPTIEDARELLQATISFTASFQLEALKQLGFVRKVQP